MSQSPQPRRRARTIMGAAIGVLALTLAACSTTGGSTGSSGGKSGKAGLTIANPSALAAGYKGSFQPPPTSGPAAQKGKKVWYISCGQAYVACANGAISFKQAGEKLGWHVTIVDGKADPNTAANEIKQAVAAHVDGVGLFTYDCPTIKSALLQAKAAHMPVVNFGSLDCNDSAFGNQAPLFAASENEMGSANQAGVWEGLGKARADYVAAALGSAGGTVINIHETSQRAHVYQQMAFAQEIATACPKCKVVNVPFTFSQVPNPATASWKSALLKNPTAKVVTWDTDALESLGLSSAIQDSGRANQMFRIGAEGNLANMTLIANGQQTSASFIPYGWYQWGLADTLNRLFAGEKAASLPSEGGGFLYVDKSHNLVGPNELPKLPVNFEADYEKVWGK
jgi:ribose transport system substrate-binding protein